MTDTYFMNLAIEQAKIAADGLEVPVGAVIVRNGEVVSVGRNRREYGKNALAHAEIEAIGTNGGISPEIGKFNFRIFWNQSSISPNISR